MKINKRISSVITIASIVTGTAGATTLTTGGDWTTPGNWDAGVPTGGDDAVIGAGLTANAGAGVSSYTGSLTLQNNSTLNVTANPGQNSFIGASSITMNAGSSINNNSGVNLSVPNINLLGDATFFTPFGASDHNSSTFGSITGAHQFETIGFNNHTFNFNSTNTFSSLLANAIDRYNIRAGAVGALGTGDVTINIRTSGTERSARLFLDVQDTIADTAILSLNANPGGGGFANDGINWVVVAGGVNEVVAGVNLYGVALAPGTYNAGDSGTDWLGGSGSITIAPPVAIPEPSTTALLGLAGLALVFRRRK